MKNVTPPSTNSKKFNVDTVVNWIYENLKIIGALVGVVIVAAAGSFFYLHSQFKSETTATDALFSAEKKYQGVVSSIKKQPDLGNAMFQMPPSEAEKSEIKEKSEAIVKEWQTAIESHKSRKAAWTHAIKLASIHFDNKDYQLAQNVLGAVKAEISAKEPFFGLVHHGFGLAMLGQQKYAEAASAFDEILRHKSQEFIFPSALFQKALAQKSLGDYKGSAETLQKLRRDFPTSSVAEMSQSHLFLLKAMSWKDEATK